MTKAQHKQAFSEVIQSSLQGWTGQSWQWDTFPSFGSLIMITDKKRVWFGVIYEVQTGSSDPSRSPFAYQKTEEELQAEQPQIFEFLKTTFSALTIGFMEYDKIYYQLAPEPPKIHAFIERAPTALCKQFFSSTNYLALIFNNPNINRVDELLLALLQEQKRLGLLSEEKISETIETMTLLTGNDYRRIKLFSSRIQS
jgi:hypothetical protein